ncbi:hypothetical protein DFH94DRAFT_740652 [Russula ochroleuca]|jgi:hypothetical protein|uniref:Uncharacterized protein n=1 Tax=Russula ochroleuca TaxID=152965 RepID=A0A9P5MVX1_9AGAM|nr:hypothetical protein DFH94DRAFT_740652 [Russula ochroleuca]
MALFTFALLTFLTASLASAGPVALDNATLLLNGQQALVLNCQFQSLQLNDPCNSGDTACIQGATATCVNGTWQALPCPSSKSCFALPEVRTNGTFIACTSPNNAASIIAATGIQADIASNCTSLGNSTLPLSTPNNTDGGNNCTQGGYGASSSPGQVSPTPAAIPQPSLTLPPTTTTLPPEQAISLISSLSASVQTVPSTSPSVNLGGNAVGVPPVILLTSIPVSSPAPTPASTPSGGYSD